MSRTPADELLIVGKPDGLGLVGFQPEGRPDPPER
jgi:hypothetical protein